MTKEKNIVIVSHKFLTQPDDDYVDFLNRHKAENILHIRHSFNEAPDRRSYFSWYKRGNLYKEGSSPLFRNLPEPLVYLKELYYTLYWVIKTGIIWDYYIGMDGLCVLFGNLLRKLLRVNKTIFWAIDFVPKSRFKQQIKNEIYHWINVHGYRNADEMWDLGIRMAEARENFLNIKKSNYKKHKVVPYGVWVDRIKKYSYRECEKNTLVFMGYLIEKQGVQLILSCMPDLIKKNPKFHFKIIGEGPYKNTLIKMAKGLGIEKHCTFLGKIEDHKVLEDEIAKSCVAIAPYIKDLDTWTYYTDPGKVKTCLACGVPLLLTDIPWNTKEIEENKCGMIISERKEDIINKILFLMKEKNNEIYRKNAQKYAQSFNYENLFINISLI